MGFGIASFLIFQNLPVIFHRLCWSSHGSVSPTQQGLRRTGILPRPIELEVRSIYVYIYIYIYKYMYICMYVCMNEWMNEWMNERTYVCIWSWLMCRSCSYWTCLFVLRQPESSDNQRGISSMLNPSDSQDYKHGEQWTDLFPDFLWPVYKIGTSINNSGSNLAKEQQSTWTGFLSNGGGGFLASHMCWPNGNFGRIWTY